MTDDLVQRLRRTYRKEYAATGSMFGDISNRLRPFPILAAEVLFNPDGKAAADRIEALTDENSKLAAGSCDVEGGKVGDEHGHFYCTLQKKVEAQAAEIERLREKINDIKEAWDWWQVDTYDRCASVVEDAINAALEQSK
jgi:hypothetical protein